MQNARRLALIGHLAALLCIAWAFAAPWLSAQHADDRFTVSLLGVWHVTGLAAGAPHQERCHWWDTGTERAWCKPKPGAEHAFRWVRSTPWLVALAAFFLAYGAILLARGGECTAPRVLAIAAAVALVLAIRIFPDAARASLWIFDGAAAAPAGSGVIAAWGAVAASVLAAVLAPVPYSSKAASERP